MTQIWLLIGLQSVSAFHTLDLALNQNILFVSAILMHMLQSKWPSYCVLFNN